MLLLVRHSIIPFEAVPREVVASLGSAQYLYTNVVVCRGGRGDKVTREDIISSLWDGKLNRHTNGKAFTTAVLRVKGR